MYPDDFSFIGGRNVIEEMGLCITEDISVAGLTAFYLSQVLQPVLTTVRQDTVSLGKEAATHLITSIEQPQYCRDRAGHGCGASSTRQIG
jgi:LacI family transcriptional regulator